MPQKLRVALQLMMTAGCLIAALVLYGIGLKTGAAVFFLLAPVMELLFYVRFFKRDKQRYEERSAAAQRGTI
jgi:membrane protein implicated in regulation of membrane protease activity